MRYGCGPDGACSGSSSAASGFAHQHRDQFRQHADETARAVEVLLPVARIDRRDLDLATAPRRMNEPVVAEVDADVRKREAPRVEEHEVAGLEIGERDLVAQPAHFLRRPGQRHAGHLLKDELNEAAAIKAGFGRRAAPAVPDADEIERRSGEILAPCATRCSRHCARSRSLEQRAKAQARASPVRGQPLRTWTAPPRREIRCAAARRGKRTNIRSIVADSAPPGNRARSETTFRRGSGFALPAPKSRLWPCSAGA